MAVGTISIHGEHLHISLSDSEGKTIGGHLLGDAIVYTTAEIVIGEMCGVEFKRELCGQSGWPELKIIPSSCSNNTNKHYSNTPSPKL